MARMMTGMQNNNFREEMEAKMAGAHRPVHQRRAWAPAGPLPSYPKLPRMRELGLSSGGGRAVASLPA